MIGTYSREVPLLPRHLATLRAPGDDPEAALIAAEDELFACEHAEQGPELSVPGFSGRVLRSLRLFVPPEEAYLLEAHFMLGQEQTQIAHRLGRAKQSVQYRIHRALERLRWVDGLQTWDRRPHEIRYPDPVARQQGVEDTVRHEIAHHLGVDEAGIRSIEAERRARRG